MKKFLLGLLMGALLSVPAMAAAYSVDVAPPWTIVTNRISNDGSDGLVSKLIDGNNTCYVATPPSYRDSKPAISCVKN